MTKKRSAGLALAQIACWGHRVCSGLDAGYYEAGQAAAEREFRPFTEADVAQIRRNYKTEEQTPNGKRLREFLRGCEQAWARYVGD